MEFKKVANAIEIIKTFCNENNYSAKKEGCNQCPFMQEEQCIFTLSVIPTEFDVLENKVGIKEEV